MKVGDTVKVKRPGAYEGLTGTITKIWGPGEFVGFTNKGGRRNSEYVYNVRVNRSLVDGSKSVEDVQCKAEELTNMSTKLPVNPDWFEKDENGQYSMFDDIEGGTVTNEHGASETDLLVRTDLLPPHALIEVSRILKTGAEKYGVDNWRRLDKTSTLNHALTHVFKYQHATQEKAPRQVLVKELAQATCRMLFTLELLLNEPESEKPSS